MLERYSGFVFSCWLIQCAWNHVLFQRVICPCKMRIFIIQIFVIIRLAKLCPHLPSSEMPCYIILRRVKTSLNNDSEMNFLFLASSQFFPSNLITQTFLYINLNFKQPTMPFLSLSISFLLV